MTNRQGQGLQIGAAILVGGKSRRLGGRPKGLFKVDGIPIAQRLIDALSICAQDIFLVGDPLGPYQALSHPIHKDLVKNKGAPGGLITALTHSCSPWIYVLACDLPYLDAESLTRLRPVPNVDAVLPMSDGQIQYLAGLWSKRALQKVRARVVEDNVSMTQIVKALDVVLVKVDNPRPYFNMNTDQDWLHVDGTQPRAIRK